MPYIVLTNQETNPERLQQTGSKKSTMIQAYKALLPKFIKIIKKNIYIYIYKPNLFKPISYTGVVIFTSTHITKPWQITLSTKRQDLSCFIPVKLLIRLQQMNNHFSHVLF